MQHYSRTLVAASNVDLNRSYTKDLEDKKLEVISEIDRFTAVKKLKIDRLRDALPLYYTVLTLRDEELKAFFATHTDDKIGLNRVKNSKATLLHLTAYEIKPLSIQWLLKDIHVADS
jgi:hypothetical protein